ncbi:MAG: thermonuclease family protein [Bythopirellula sp.]|nr:thermonuclease family protein [Bythopirellula sp.]
MHARIRRDPRSQIVTILVVVALVLLSWWFEPYLPTNDVPTRSPGALRNGQYEVLRVVDGDTLLLKKDRLRVRLQGVDTPETVKEHTAVEEWGPQATAYTERFVREARNMVSITVDGEGVDQYGRHLAFVWHDERLLNEELIGAGLARAKLGYDYSQRMKDRLRSAQDRARREHLGIWSD